MRKELHRNSKVRNTISLKNRGRKTRECEETAKRGTLTNPVSFSYFDSDTRLGAGPQTVSCDFKKVFKVHDKLYYGLAGLGTDVQTMSELLDFRMRMYELREERKIKPKTFGSVLCNILYSRRFGPYFTEPVVAGLDAQNGNKPYLCAMDLIGAPVFTDDFLVAGTCSDNLYGTCESLYQPDMDPETLFETLSQALLAAVDRAALSGWGATVTIITPTETFTRKLQARMD